MRGKIIVVTMFLLFLNASVLLAEVRYKQYYDGLPDLDKLSPFAGHENAQASQLRVLLLKPTLSLCDQHQQAAQIAGVQELCGSLASDIHVLLAKMSKGLPSGRFSRLWLTELEPGQDRTLIAQYDVQHSAPPDRYAAFFVFQWRNDRYRVRYANWFLEGSLHAVRPFGPANRRIVFIRVLSCTECHPWVYLVALDFLSEPYETSYEFNYTSDNAEGWGPQIEYVLPGMGHSIDAKVETRLPEQSSSGQHLLQYFDVENGEDEWWSFSCQGLRCKPKVFKGQAPDWFTALWNRAERL